ncbi:MAG: hypothetical protein AB7I25_10575 [Vicinamibacterales bacterium]
MNRGLSLLRHGRAPRVARAIVHAARVAGVVCLAGALLAACGGGRAYGHGDKAARNGDWDAAVSFYRRAVQQSPDRSDYRIALERAMINASSVHMDQARVFEARTQLDEALREYRRANEFNPTSRVIASKVQELERRVREQLEASQPKPSIQQMRERARQEGTPPLLNLTAKLPLIRFTNSSVRDILNFVGSSTNLNVTYDRDFQDRAYTVQLDDITLEEALNQILSANQYFYKVVNDHTITVIPDTPQKRAQYEEQVIRTFYVSHADATELAQLLTTMIRLPNMAVQPRIVANKAANTITVGATANVAAIIEKVIESNDNPRAEVVVDVQILEINRSRAKQFGLDLSTYAIGGVFSPESDPRATAGGDGQAGGGGNGSTPQPFNLNSISRGINTGDFYLSVPSAVVRFLENDTETKLIAKPQLRGAEGQKITLNLGDDIPVPSTVFTPFAQGGANINPLTSFNYKTVGVVVEMTPRVTFEDDIILELTVESSSLGPNITIGGQALPSFGTRKVQTKLRLRDGESNLLAGLLREDERKSLRGFPAILRLPILKQLLSSNDNEVKQTDIVMLLTPRLVRTHELTQQDVSPIFIGTQQNLGLGGPPPLIAPVEPAPAVPPAAAPAAAPPAPVIPPGSSPLPGTTTPAGASPQALQLPQAPPSVVQPPPSAPATQVLLTSPSPELRVGGGPYTVPISVANASRLSALSVTVTFNPAVLRVRTVQEGSFMRQGGNAAQFTQQVDGTVGRIDLAVTRTQDQTGASGAGLVAAVLFDVVGPGQANFSLSGSATVPGGGAAGLQFAPAPVSAR